MAKFSVTRRELLVGGVALGGTVAARLWPAKAEPRRFELAARPGKLALLDPPRASTAIWGYGGTAPGPVIRARQGETLRVQFKNELPQDSTVHWHGLRVPNAMDGVPGLTQKPVAPGESFVYEFASADAGTYWYHPHVRTHEQKARGLAGLIIIEEAEPIRVDRDVAWALDDWRLDDTGAIAEDFGNFMDVSHAGRIGDLVTVNGVARGRFAVKAGERIRLRLANIASARVMALDFAGHQPVVVALDGHPVEPHPPEGGMVVLAPGQRVDLVLDAVGKPGEKFAVTSRYYRGEAEPIALLAYEDGKPLRQSPLDAPMRLAANPLAEPDLSAPQNLAVVLGGGMMNPKVMRGEVPVDQFRADMRAGRVWNINGVSAAEHEPKRLFQLARGQTAVMELVNDTAFDHPMHLHGHSFLVTSRNGERSPRREWRDTILLGPGERARVAFVADNPGDWMFHCHVLEHALGGMGGVLRVT